jgi:hypothetical protein
MMNSSPILTVFYLWNGSWSQLTINYKLILCWWEHACTIHVVAAALPPPTQLGMIWAPLQSLEDQLLGLAESHKCTRLDTPRQRQYMKQATVADRAEKYTRRATSDDLSVHIQNKVFIWPLTKDWIKFSSIIVKNMLPYQRSSICYETTLLWSEADPYIYELL